MTRCTEFYEKLERDGNFCGMREQDFRESLVYFKNVEKDKNGIPLLSFDVWLKQQRKTAETNKHKTERFVGTKSAKKQSEEPKEERFRI